MPLRPCLGLPGRPCPRLTGRSDSRCQTCASARGKARDAARGSRHQRGYGTDHDDRRAYLLEHLVPGAACDRCWLPMYATQELDAAHPHDKPLRTHPDSVADHLEHSSCNRGAQD